jgi:hypothetical protein
VSGSTAIAVVKMMACVIVGSAWPTFSVPGISSSGIRLRNLIQAVVDANEPMPSVSKKFAMKPNNTFSIRAIRLAGPRATLCARSMCVRCQREVATKSRAHE